MSHHYSGPDFGFPRGDARLDLTDLYAFPKPGDAGKSILIMDVHPSAAKKPPGPTTAEPFAPEAIYELKIDTDGDAVANIAYRVRFSASKGGTQTATLRRAEGAQAAGAGDGGQAILEGAPVSTGREAQVTEVGNYRFFAGWRSDPFFFDVEGALNNLQFTGDDYFADKDVCSIVLELPNSALGSKAVGLWARTLVPADGAGVGWVQADRGALPALTPFLAGEQNAAYLAGEPADDARFVAVVEVRLLGANHAGRHRVDPHLRGPLDCEGLGKGSDGPFAGAVRGYLIQSDKGGKRTDINDATVSPFDHVPAEYPTATQGPVQIRRDDRVPV